MQNNHADGYAPNYTRHSTRLAVAEQDRRCVQVLIKQAFSLILTTQLTLITLIIF
jgi:hypothetical protein